MDETFSDTPPNPADYLPQQTQTQATKCIVQFIWDGGNEDYLCHREMTPEQIEEVSALLTRANAHDIIRGGWYVGPLGENTHSHADYIGHLKEILMIGEESDSEGGDE